MSNLAELEKKMIQSLKASMDKSKPKGEETFGAKLGKERAERAAKSRARGSEPLHQYLRRGVR